MSSGGAEVEAAAGSLRSPEPEAGLHPGAPDITRAEGCRLPDRAPGAPHLCLKLVLLPGAFKGKSGVEVCVCG